MRVRDEEVWSPRLRGDRVPFVALELRLYDPKDRADVAAKPATLELPPGVVARVVDDPLLP